MQQFGGKDSKRHFTVVMGNKENGLYVSSSPSSAAKKAVTKLCTSNKSKKVEFYMREITQNSKKKTYGPYAGYIEKLKVPIELKGRIIKYKPFAKLIRKKGVKKGGMFRASIRTANSEMECIHDRNFEGNTNETILRLNPDEDVWAIYEDGSPIILEPGEKVIIINRNIRKYRNGEEYFYIIKKNNRAGGLVKAKYIKCSNPSVKSSNNWLLEFQPNNKAKYRRPPTSLPGLRGQSAYNQAQPTSLPGLRGQSAYNQRKPTSLSEFSGESAYTQRQPTSLSGLRGQSAYNQAQPIGLSDFSGQSAYTQRQPTSLDTNIVIEKLYNSVDNLELLESITGHTIQNVFIPKGQVVDVLGTVTHFKDKYNKIGVLTPQGYIQGFVESKYLKKTRWLCDHNTCLNCNGPYDKDQSSNRNIPVSVAVILRNKQGKILVATETDYKKMSEFNKSLPGYHLCAGKIDPGSCPVFSCYDETAEESRFLPVKKLGRNFRLWDSFFKPDGKYRMTPWLSSGRAIVFVGEISDNDLFWDASSPPNGKPEVFKDPKQLDIVFQELRENLPETSENHKYKEKINFKWVTPLPKGSSNNDWEKWSRDNQMFDWGRSIIQDYVKHSAQPAQLQPRQPIFSHSMQNDMPHGMPHGMAAPSYNFRNNTSASSARSANLNESNKLYQNVLKKANGHRIEKVSKNKYIIHYSDNYRTIYERHPDMFNMVTENINRSPLHKTEDYFDGKIRQLIDSRMTSGETRLSDLLELCKNTYQNMFKQEIPKEKLRELESDIRSNPISSKNGKNIIFRKI
jgi:hypothetical protein